MSKSRQIENLRRLYQSRTNMLFRRIIDLLADMPDFAEDHQTIVDDLMEILPLGRETRQDVIFCLRKIASSHVGDFIVGRRGSPSRLEWGIEDPQAFARSVQGTECGDVPDSEESDEDSDIMADCGANHREPTKQQDLPTGIQLRPDAFVRIVGLPFDLTAEEADRLSKYILTLPMNKPF